MSADPDFAPRSFHDHSDKRIFGFTITRQRATEPQSDGSHTFFEHREDVPAWWFTCPGCKAGPESAAYCDTWTPDGMAWMREHGINQGYELDAG